MKLNSYLSDGMIIKRDTPFDIEGITNPNQKVKVTCLGEVYQTYADDTGLFDVSLNPLEAGGPYTIKIEADETRIIDDVLSGDVYLLGGQSNMELPLNRVLDLYKDEVEAIHNPKIRQFQVPQIFDFKQPRMMLDGGKWIKAVTPHQMDFSAVGYFFAEALYQENQVPIGLIHAAVGGTPIESWISEPTLLEFGGYETVLNKCKNDKWINEVLEEETRVEQAWYQDLNARDEGLKHNWYEVNSDFSSASTMPIPISFSETDLSGFFGVVWFKKTITLDKKPKTDAFLKMGTIIDADEIFINGHSVGKTEYRYPPRRYPIPKSHLEEGENTIVIRLIVNQSEGGFVEGMPYQLITDTQTIDLEGNWQYKVGLDKDQVKPVTFFRNNPAGLYNAMIAPLENYPINAILFYQGESNTGAPENYSELQSAMVSDWRSQWQDETLPFYYVQLANLETGNDKVESNWSILRDEQRRALEIPYSKMAVILDVGEWNELHPQDKKTVGERLSRFVLHEADPTLTPMGPLIKHIEREPEQLRCTFDYSEGHLVIKGDTVYGFEVSENGTEFHPAEAIVVGGEVWLPMSNAKDITCVRYLWKDNPDQANLYNLSGLLASPFKVRLED